MANYVNPLVVPGEQSCPDLKLLERLDLFSEDAADASQCDDVCSLDLFGFFGQASEVSAVQARERLLEEYAYESGTADVKIGEVGRVALVEVVVAFGDGVVRSSDNRSEEMRLCELSGLEVELPDEVLEDTELFEGQRAD